MEVPRLEGAARLNWGSVLRTLAGIKGDNFLTNTAQCSPNGKIARILRWLAHSAFTLSNAGRSACSDAASPGDWDRAWFRRASTGVFFSSAELNGRLRARLWIINGENELVSDRRV